eukprot:Lankesteria_metandrocarpae@DN5216_c0_g3_i1.p2
MAHDNRDTLFEVVRVRFIDQPRGEVCETRAYEVLSGPTSKNVHFYASNDKLWKHCLSKRMVSAAQLPPVESRQLVAVASLPGHPRRCWALPHSGGVIFSCAMSNMNSALASCSDDPTIVTNADGVS